MIEKLKSNYINNILPDINAIAKALNQGEIDINSQFDYYLRLENANYLFQNETLLCFSVRQEQLDMVRFLLSYPGVDINLGTAITSPLSLSISQKNQEIFNLLLEHGAIIKKDDMHEIFEVFGFNEALEIINNLLEKRFISEEAYKNLVEVANYKNYTLTLISYTPLIPKHPCLSIYDTLISNTHSDLKLSALKQLYYKAHNTSLVTRDVVVGVAVKYSFNENDNKLVIVKDSKYKELSHYDEHNGILVSTFSGLDDETACFIHELSHLFFTLIFDNDSNPYPQQAFAMQHTPRHHC